MDNCNQVVVFMIIAYTPIIIFCLAKLVKDTNREYKQIKRLIKMGRYDLLNKLYGIDIKGKE